MTDDCKEEFTPGPWVATNGNTSGREVLAPNSPKSRARVARMGGTDRDGNSHLIAAAPDMYEALKMGARDLHTAASMLPDVHEALIKTVEQMQDAMAKARGE